MQIVYKLEICNCVLSAVYLAGYWKDSKCGRETFEVET